MQNFFHRCRLDRSILRLSGPDRVPFLQGLVSCDITKARPDQAVYGAFLTPQGKFLHDFFCLHTAPDTPDGTLLLDVRRNRADDFLRRLKPFRLRSKIDLLLDSDLAVYADSTPTETIPGQIGAGPDPRHPAMGWRIIAPFGDFSGDDAAYQSHRIRNGIPEATEDLLVEQSILLEGNLDLLHGIDWQKGCYMGQEVTARTHYRGLIKKRLFPCRIDAPCPPPGTLLYAHEREIGDVRSGDGTWFLACLRLDFVAQGHSQSIQIDGRATHLEIAVPDWLAPALMAKNA